jgi:hypothetical protein
MVMLYQFRRCAGKDWRAAHSLCFCEAKRADNSSDDALTGTCDVVIALQHFEEIFLVGFLSWEEILS